MLWFSEWNLGFAGTCNRGYRESTGEVVVFLNSDTIVPRSGLIRLVESLVESASIGAAGPMTNNAGYHHPVPVTYTDLRRIDGFADDFAYRNSEDEDVSMLVGFCLAVRRSAVDEVAETPGHAFDERFGRGMFEDNDLCYRMERAGYRLRLATRAFVHHTGHRTLSRLPEPMERLLHRNQSLFEQKWQSDVECGFASHLPGANWQRVRFDPARKPERLRRERERLCQEADISLCMIVRNEERVLDACLASVEGVFNQVVVVDTGSSDRTKEIAANRGAEVFDFEWPESFALARNESLRHARGKWVMWMDADDTLATSSADLILDAVIHARSDIVAFVIPVRFTDGGATGGTQVDHVKLFRNLPGVSFEGRIHEQVLQSLRPRGEIARLEGAVVLHSGYDTSAEGQARKRVRDPRLLALDLAERPGHPFVLFNHGMTDHYNGEHERAIEWLRASIEAASPGESHVRKAYSLMGVSLRQLERPLDALAVFDDGLAAVGNDAELQFQAALVLTALGRLEEARERYLAMPSDTTAYFSSIDVAILGPKRHHNLGMVCAGLDRYAEAKANLVAAINLGFGPSALALFEFALPREDFRAAREAADAFGRLEGWPVEWFTLRAKLAEATGGDPLAELQGLARRHPTDTKPRLAMVRWLLQRSTDGGSRHAELISNLLHDLDAAGVAEAAYYRGIHAIQEGNLLRALVHHRRALRLDPAGRQNVQQVQTLLNALAEERRGREALVHGPHIGRLGPASLALSAVVVTFNSERYIADCAESILSQLGPDGELIIVDNASSDSTSGVLASIATDPRVRLILNEANVGYAKAANQGILASQGEVLLLCNPDVTLGADCIARSLAQLEAGVGAVGPLSDNVGGDQFVGHWLRPGAHPSREELPAYVAELHGNDYRETQLLMGLCLFLRRETLDELGLLEEGCELGADDLELSWRLQTFGLALRIPLSAFAYHVGGASFQTLPSAEKQGRIEQSDNFLRNKLAAFNCPKCPTSSQLWGCDILADRVPAHR